MTEAVRILYSCLASGKYIVSMHRYCFCKNKGQDLPVEINQGCFGKSTCLVRYLLNHTPARTLFTCESTTRSVYYVDSRNLAYGLNVWIGRMCLDPIQVSRHAVCRSSPSPLPLFQPNSPSLPPLTETIATDIRHETWELLAVSGLIVLYCVPVVELYPQHPVH